MIPSINESHPSHCGALPTARAARLEAGPTDMLCHLAALCGRERGRRIGGPPPRAGLLPRDLGHLETALGRELTRAEVGASALAYQRGWALEARWRGAPW